MTNIQGWNKERERSVAQEQGDLALVGLHLIERSMQVEGIPGTWAPLAVGEPGLTLTASAADCITIDGSLVEGTVKLEMDRTIVRFSETRTATATEQPGSEHLLAVWDAESEAIHRFERITTFPFDPLWVIEAEFVAENHQRVVAFAHTSDQAGRLRHHQSPGDIYFFKDGVPYHLSPFVSGDSLIIVFADKTSGKETYGMGRMLVVLPGLDGKVTLDFNRSFLPPCAFSYHFNCPLPPAQNRLPFEVLAGEKQVSYRDK